ncbi:sodium ion-translocating decarboxylase subunit beta [Acutalibacter sp. 1XD8-33]|uniref:sodium ion-translocating decarboxylase subunit beta n=1 Tax=Acutalibacter sp. 1XD8-33 TaxID=2320081 RepID=UPI001FAA6240|nr:sodium ion-translocating decarboxylase subunit beta [Acutalibacter sp. 1XD8-33]
MLQHMLDIGIIGGADGPTAIFTTLDPDIVEALGIMGKGMLGIFVVIGLIAIIVSLLTKLGSQK